VNLLPCPWCGGPVRVGEKYDECSNNPSTSSPAIVCDTCIYQIDFGFGTVQQIVSAWNERYTEPETKT
jgi:hypothetical protein